jgi:hypothetical protein
VTRRCRAACFDETCKNKEAACSSGKYDPARSPRFAELAPRYNTARMNGGQFVGRALPHRQAARVRRPDRQLRRIVQTPGGISVFYDVGQGQGWQRNIVMDGRPHLSASLRQWATRAAIGRATRS